MIVSEIPKFLENPEWYYYDTTEGCYKLTDKAPQEAKESYAEFYELVEGVAQDDTDEQSGSK